MSDTLNFVLSRRALFTTGAVVAVAAASAGVIAAGKLDDVAQLFGVTPLELPDPRDKELLKTVVASESAILLSLRSEPAWASLAKLSELHVEKLGGPVKVDGIRTIATWEALRQARDARINDAQNARSSSFAMVLASIAASHEQQRLWIEAHS